METQRRIYATLVCLRPFITQHWNFKTDNFINLYAELNESEKSKFFFDVKIVSGLFALDLGIYFKRFFLIQIRWREYVNNYLLGIKKYILKEKMEKLPEARSNFKR